MVTRYHLGTVPIHRDQPSQQPELRMQRSLLSRPRLPVLKFRFTVSLFRSVVPLVVYLGPFRNAET